MEYIEKIFKKSGWISIVESVIFAILGLILIWKPEGTVKVISYILGIIFIVVGIYKIVNYISAKGKYDFFNYDSIFGIIAIIMGIVTIRYSSAIGSIFRIIIGIWIIYSALIRMGLSVKLKNMNLNIWIYSLIIAIIMLVLRTIYNNEHRSCYCNNRYYDGSIITFRYSRRHNIYEECERNILEIKSHSYEWLSFVIFSIID